jgi:hypothetical protein
MTLFAAHDGQFVNTDHIVTIELLQHKTGAEANTWQVRARTSIAWGTGGYGHSTGHLVVLGDKFPTELEAREWIVKTFG